MSVDRIEYARDRVGHGRLVRVAVLVASAIVAPTMGVRGISSGVNLVLLIIFGGLILHKTDPLFGATGENVGSVFFLAFSLVFSGFIGMCFDIGDFVQLVIALVESGSFWWLLTLLVLGSLAAQLIIVWRLWPLARMAIDPSYAPAGLGAGSTELLPRTTSMAPQPFAGPGQRLGGGTE